MQLSVMIAARAGKEQTLSCIQSVFRTFHEHREETEFILVDDCSDPVHEIQAIFQGFRKSAKANVQIFRAKCHKHYSAGLALCLSQCQGESALFLSNDMIVTPDYVNTLMKVAAKNPQAGIVRGTSQYVDSHIEHQICSSLPLRSYKDINAFSHFLAEYHDDYCTEDKLLCGDAMLIKRALIERIGVTDPCFYGYFGDIDYGLRAQRAGFKLLCAKGAWLYHSGAVSIKWENSQEQTQHGRGFDDRMQIVQDAYTVFRKKWDPTLPEKYPYLPGFDFNQLQQIPIDFDLHQAWDPSLLSDYEIL